MNELQVQIEVKDGINVVSSRVIAKQLGKRHADVINQIDNIFNDENVRGQIIESNYEHRGNIYREYLLTKNGFTLYMFNIQGYNEFKIAYINKFNEMEEYIKNQQLKLSERDTAILSVMNANTDIERIGALKQFENTITKPLIETIEVQKPLVDFAETIASNADSIEIGVFAKLIKDEGINMGRNKLFQWLRDNKYLMKNNVPYQKYVDNKWFEIVEYAINTPYGEKLCTKTLITGLGQIRIVEKLRIEI